MKAKSFLSDWFCNDCSKRISSELLLHRLSKNGFDFTSFSDLRLSLNKFVFEHFSSFLRPGFLSL